MSIKLGFMISSFILTSLIACAQPMIASASVQRFTRVIYMVLENEDSVDVLKDPYFKNLAEQGARFSNFFAEGHPSQPNYIAMIAGDTLGVKNNSNVDLDEKHLGDLLEAKGIEWRVYAEDFPGNCYLGVSKNDYARRHLPFLSFVNVQKDSKRCSRIVNTQGFFSDWQESKLANFNLLIPNNKNNGHDTNIGYSAQWLKKNFDGIFKNPALMKDTLVIITYDEGSYKSNNQIYTIFLGPSVIPGSLNKDKHTHYSLLRLFEEEWGLASLNRGDLTSSSILSIWR